MALSLGGGRASALGEQLYIHIYIYMVLRTVGLAIDSKHQKPDIRARGSLGELKCFSCNAFRARALSNISMMGIVHAWLVPSCGL